MLFYADENFPFDTVVELRRLGHDVLTALEDERANQKVSDEKFWISENIKKWNMQI